MRKEVLCALVVLLGGGWAEAQQAPTGTASNAGPQAPAPAVWAVPTAGASPNGEAAAGGYPGGYGYYSPYGYNYGTGYDYSGYWQTQGYAPGQGTGYPSGGAQAQTGAKQKEGPQTGQSSGVALAAGGAAGHAPDGGVVPVQYGGYYPSPYGYGYGYGGGGYGYGTGYGYGPESGTSPQVPFDTLNMDMGPRPEKAPPPPPPVPSTLTGNEHIWGSIEYVAAWMRAAPLNTPLVTTGSATDISIGALGAPGTAVVFGAGNLDFNLMSGVRMGAGLFLDTDHQWSVDVGGVYFTPQHIRATYTSDANGNPLYARPLTDVNGNSGVTLPGTQGAETVSFPGNIAGSTMVDASSHLWGLEASGRYNFLLASNLACDFLTGLRVLHLDEDITIQDTLNPISTGFLTFLGNGVTSGQYVNPGSTLQDRDYFGTSNTFYGANLGARLRWQQDWFFLSAYSNLGLGVTDQKVHIQGSTTVTSPAGTTNFAGNPVPAVQTANGGILALPSNIGNYSRSTFTYVPEVGLTLGVEPCKHVRITAGYSFLYWSSVVRPGAQIDPQVSRNQVPGDQTYGGPAVSTHPLFTFNSQSFYVNMLRLGLELYY